MLEVKQIEVSMLKEWKGNPRINDDAVNAVARSIESFGFNVPILCDRRFTIISGHTRWKAAKKIGMESIPVIVLDMKDTQCKAFSIADNKTGEIAEWDFLKLPELLNDLRLKEIDLSSLGFNETELEAILTQEQDFNWKVFEDDFMTQSDSEYTLLPIKVRSGMKERFHKVIRERAKEKGI